MLLYNYTIIIIIMLLHYYNYYIVLALKTIYKLIIIKFSKISVFDDGKSTNDFNKKKTMKNGTEDALQLGKYTKSSKMQISSCFFLH